MTAAQAHNRREGGGVAADSFAVCWPEKTFLEPGLFPGLWVCGCTNWARGARADPGRLVAGEARAVVCLACGSVCPSVSVSVSVCGLLVEVGAQWGLSSPLFWCHTRRLLREHPACRGGLLEAAPLFTCTLLAHLPTVLRCACPLFAPTFFASLAAHLAWRVWDTCLWERPLLLIAGSFVLRRT